MKKLIVIGIAVIMVAGLVSAANAAYDPSWIVNIKVSRAGDGATDAWTTILGTAPAAATTVAPPPGPSAVVYAYSENSGSLIKDQRASFNGTTMSWVIRFSTANYTGGAPTTLWAYIWNPADTAIVKTNAFAPLGGETLKLYASTDGIAKGDLLWTVVSGGTGGTADANTFKLGGGPTGAGFAIGNTYILEAGTGAPVIPEPGSILALASGLVGLMGFGIRRRK